MKKVLAEVGSFLGGLVEPVAALAFTLVGSVVELNALSVLSGGDTSLGLWLAYMGGVALIAGLFVVGGGLPRQLFALASSE